jgi:patatin-like phospholipase/acyl hydrolase
LQKILHEGGIRKDFTKIFDLIAGTSTGALIALGLAAAGQDGRHPRFSIQNVFDLYQVLGPKIFPQDRYQQLRIVRQAFSDKYDAEDFKNILKRFFGDLTLKDCITNVLVTSYDIDAWQPVIFKRRPSKGKWGNDPNFYLRDVTRASSSAPTYFEPARIHSVGDHSKVFSLIDGGIFANNPSMCAYIEVRKLYPRAKNVTILSLGTGKNEPRYGYSQMKEWGYLDWIDPGKGLPISYIMSNGQSECVNHQLAKLPGVTFIRINDYLHNCNHALDDASKKNMKNLIVEADRIADDFKEELEYFTRLL